MIEHVVQISLEQVPPVDRAAALGALLLVASEAVSLGTLAHQLGCGAREVRTALRTLAERLGGVGMVLQWCDDDRVQIASDPRFASLVQRFLGLERTVRLSQAALETLAIVAYRQPVTRADVDAVRGVDSTGVLQTLIARNLIEPVGRLATPGTPIQYGTTPEFLRFFGLSSLHDLPTAPESLAPARQRADRVAAHEDGR